MPTRSRVIASLLAIAAAVALVLAPMSGTVQAQGESEYSALDDFGVYLSVLTGAIDRQRDFGEPYQFGDDPTEPAQRDDDFAQFESVYVGAAVFPDGLTVDCETADGMGATFCDQGFLGVDTDEVYVVFQGVANGDIPPMGPAEATIQYSFPYSFTGATVFQPLDAFPGDTWQYTARQPWVQADFGEGFQFNTSQWDGSRFLAPESGSFGFVHGNEFVVVVPSTDIVGLSTQAEAALSPLQAAVREDIANFTAESIAAAFAGFSWGSAIHIHLGDFGAVNPSLIQAGPPKPHGPDGLFQGLTDNTPLIYPPLFPGKPDVFPYDATLPGPAHLMMFEGPGGFTWDAQGLQYGWEAPEDAVDRIVLEQHLFIADVPGGQTPADRFGLEQPQVPCAELGTFLTSASEVACNDAMFGWFGDAFTGGLPPGDGLFTVTFDFADELIPTPDGDFFVTEALFDFADGGFVIEGAGAGADFRFGLSNGGGDLVAVGQRWDSGSGSWVDDPNQPVGYQMVDDVVTLWLTRSMFDGANPLLGVVATWSGADVSSDTLFKTDHGVLDTGGVCPFAAEESFWTASFPVIQEPGDTGTATDGSSDPTDGGEDGSEAESGSFPWIIPLGAGLVLVVAGGWLFLTSREEAEKDCDEEKRAWDAALAHLREVRAELDEYKSDLDENISNLNRVRRELRDANKAKRTSGSLGDGPTSHPFQDGLITSEGLDQLISDLERQLEAYETGHADRQGRFDRALIRFDAAKDAERTAREAYGACIGATMSAPIEALDPGPVVEEEAPPLEEPEEPVDPGPPIIEFDFDEPDAPEIPDIPDPEPTPPVVPEPAGPAPGSGLLDPGPTPPTPGLTPPEMDDQPDSFCDWAFYVNDGGTLKVVRPVAQGAHECCKYVLTISSTPGFSVSSSGITPDAAGDEHPRDTSIIAYNAYKGADAWGRASTRTWPQGAIGAMFGEGWPTIEPTEGEWPDVFDPSTGERPDVGAFTLRPDQTDIMVEFTDGCGGSQHRYSHNASSRVHVQADQECTNRNHEPYCPVELSVSGQIRASASGAMAYPVIDPGASIASDTDELPSRIVTDENGNPMLEASQDSHDHVTRDDSAYRFTMSNTSSSPNQVQDNWHGRWTHSLQLVAGLRVPDEVRGQTDRATARITGDIAHSLDLQGSATSQHGGLAGSTCDCGADSCRCEPAFKLEIDGGDVALRVDGRIVASLYRPDDPDLGAIASSEVIWTLTAPPTFGLSRPEPDRPSPPDVNVPI